MLGVTGTRCPTPTRFRRHQNGPGTRSAPAGPTARSQTSQSLPAPPLAHYTSRMQCPVPLQGNQKRTIRQPILHLTTGVMLVTCNFLALFFFIHSNDIFFWGSPFLPFRRIGSGAFLPARLRFFHLSIDDSATPLVGALTWHFAFRFWPAESLPDAHFTISGALRRTPIRNDLCKFDGFRPSSGRTLLSEGGKCLPLSSAIESTLTAV